MRTIVLAMLLALATPAHAVYYTGNMLLEQCESDLGQAGDICGAYIASIYDAHNAFVGWNDLAKRQWCPRGNVTLGQLRRVVIAYIRSHPEAVDMTASSHVANALIQAFPCH